MIAPEVGAQEIQDVYMKSFEVNIETMRDVIAEIGRQSQLHLQRLEADKAFYERAKQALKDAFQLVRAEFEKQVEQAAKIAEAGGQLMLGGKASVPHFGWGSAAQFEKNLQDKKKALQDADAAFGRGEFKIDLPGLGQVDEKTLDAAIAKNALDRANIQKALNEGTYAVNFPLVGNVNRKNCEDQIAKNEKDIAGVKDQAAKGEFSYFIPPLGFVTLTKIQAEIDNARKQMRDLDDAYGKKKFVIDRPPIGWTDAEGLEKAIAAKQKEIQDHQNALSQGTFSAWFGLAWYTRKILEAEVAGTEKGIRDVQQAVSDGTYQVMVGNGIGWMNRRGIEASLRTPNLPPASAAALRKALGQIPALAKLDVEFREAVRSLEKKWIAMIPDLSKVMLENLQLQLVHLQGLAGEFEPDWKDRKAVLQRRIDFLEMAKSAKNVRQTILQPWYDSVAVCQDGLKAIQHQAELKRKQDQDWLNFHTNNGQNGIQVVSQRMLEEYQRQKEQWSKIAAAAPALEIQNGYANVPVLGYMLVVDIVKRVDETIAAIDQAAGQVQAGITRFHVPGMGFLSQNDRLALVLKLTQALQAFDKSASDGTYRIQHAAGWVGRKDAEEAIAKTEKTIADNVALMDKGEYSLHLTGIGYPNLKSYEKSLADVSQQKADLQKSFDAEDLAIYRISGWFKMKDLRSVMAAAKKDIDGLAAAVGGGTLKYTLGGVYADRLQWETALKTAEKGIDDVKASVAAKAYAVPLAAGNMVNAKQVEEALKNPQTRPADRSALETALRHISIASQADIAIRELEAGKIRKWIAAYPQQVKLQSDKQQKDLDQSALLQGEFAIELQNAFRHLERKLQWLMGYRVFFP